MKRVVFRTCLLIGVWASAAHAALRPNDFAEGVELYPAGDAPVQRVELTPAVYAGAVRADLGDLRVFDSEGELLPYAVVARSAAPLPDAAFVSVPLFPLPEADRVGAALNVRVDAAGAVISVQGTSAVAERVTAAGGTSAYLLDASAKLPPLRELELSFGGAGDAVGNVRVEGSDDLQHFETLVDAAPVTRLEYGGRSLSRRRILLPDVRARYLRLTVGVQGAAMPLAAVGGRRGGLPSPQPRLTDSLGGVMRDTGLEFGLGATLPVVGIEVDLGVDNSLLDARVLCRRDSGNAPAGWAEIGRAVFYRVRRGADVRIGESAPMRSERCLRLRIEPVQSGVTLPPAARVRAQWMPAELWFLRRGDRPHLLAYGNSLASPATSPVTELTQQLTEGAVVSTVPWARIGRHRVLGGPAQRIAAPPLDWQRLTLWGVLVLGVALVLGLAWRVLREQRTPSV